MLKTTSCTRSLKRVPAPHSPLRPHTAQVKEQQALVLAMLEKMTVATAGGGLAAPAHRRASVDRGGKAASSSLLTATVLQAAQVQPRREAVAVGNAGRAADAVPDSARGGEVELQVQKDEHA